MSKYGAISGPYFAGLELNTEIYGINLCIQSEYLKMRTRNNSVFGHFSCRECDKSDKTIQKLLISMLQKNIKEHNPNWQ